MTMYNPEKTVKRIEDALSRHEHDQYCDFELSKIADKINWLWKFRYISEAKMNELASRVTELFETGWYD